jgi:hypothetical protein
MNRRQFARVSFSLAMLALFAASTGRAEDFVPSTKGKKLIASGWHIPSPTYVRDHIAEMEKLPFDGLILGTCYPFWSKCRNGGAALDELVTNVSATHFQKFKDNFLGVESGNDNTFDWFDAPRCEELARNWKAIARAAKKAGMVGLKFDPECYEGPSPFEYSKQPQRKTKSGREYADRVAKVAAQVIRAINEEYPDVTILFYFGPSVGGHRRNLEGWCGLVPPFIDGMLSEARSGLKIVDGYEQAYAYRTEKQYQAARATIKRQAALTPGLATAFEKHVQAGFAIWPDAWSGPWRSQRKSWNADDPLKNFYTPDELAYATHNALKYSDQYVWMWAESLNFWQGWGWVYHKPDDRREQRPIPAAYVQALARAKQPTVSPPPKR